MRLKKLILQGFKSFADRTEFLFDSPITGIVGPNGCGKSNVVDGFKWVLGEQSAKSLRGDAMMDVIFNGSSTRKPSGLAEVTLVFENPQRADGTRLLNLDADEVSVGRRLFRDGTSEYQLNTHASRLKDIRELFLDTGVGVDAYSVIEQGKVSAMLEANPEERRLIFEEAAGISKYKVKKKEAQRKLERVDQNLLRLNDIVEEVEKRLRSVKVQAGKARNYQEYLTHLNTLRLTFSLQEYHTLHTQAGELETQQADAQFRLDDASGDLQRQQNELNTQREQHDVTSQSRQRAEYELVQAKAQVQSAQQRQDYAREQLQQIADQIESFESDLQNATQRLSETDVQLANEKTSLESLTADVNSKRSEIDDRQQAFRDGQLQLNQLNKEIEQNKSVVLDAMRKLAATNSRIASIEIEQKNIAQQQLRLNDRRSLVLADIESTQAARAQLQSQLEVAQGEISNLQNQTAEKRADAETLGKKNAEISQTLGAAKEHRSGLASRQQLLQDLESRREGVSEGVKAVLRQREKFPFVRGIVADVLRVDVEHAFVIEAALNGADQTLLCESQTAAAGSHEMFGELSGRVNFLCIDRLHRDTGFQPVPENSPAQNARDTDWNQFPHRIRFAVDLVKFGEKDSSIVQHLLGKTIIVDDLAAARDLHQTAPRIFRYVTKAGEVIEADGTLRAGPLTAAMGLLSRRSELEAIVTQIVETDSRIASLTHQLTNGNAQAKQIEEQLNTLRNAMYQANTVKVEVGSKISQAGDKLAGLQREAPVLNRELAALAQQVESHRAESEKLAESKLSLENQQANAQRRIDEMGKDQIRIAEELKISNETLTSLRVSLGQVQEKQLAAQQAVQRHVAHSAELNQQIERINKSSQALESRREQVEHELAQATHAEASLHAQQDELAERLKALSESLAQMQAALAESLALVEATRAAHAEVEKELHRVQLAASEVKVRVETLVQRTMEELQLDLPAKHAEGYEPAEMDWAAVGEEIKLLRDKISRLGNVNIDAISEQDELEQRQQFLATQSSDLTTSKLQLEELIDTINLESSARFEETFNAVREHFQGMFRKLFGGGKADVYLETELEDQKPAEPIMGPDGQMMMPVKKKIDLLDAGIEIIAKPPGKQPCSISQLSGGEKTMTCVALLMSIFKSKPSPFCILDEVDAALDEANNQRFNLIVQEFLEMSQFIIITHSKRTMQIADVLYGVTMQEQGVSKRVAVKFDQVDSAGRIGDTAAA